MKLCNDTITVFNKRSSNGDYIYVPTIINGVSWYGSTVSSLTDKGLNAANQYIVRIPTDADSGGKVYADPVSYRNAQSVSGLWTLQAGDIIVKGAVPTTRTTTTNGVTTTTAIAWTPSSLKAGYSDFMTVLGVTDNRRAPNAPHFRVVGR